MHAKVGGPLIYATLSQKACIALQAWWVCDSLRWHATGQFACLQTHKIQSLGYKMRYNPKPRRNWGDPTGGDRTDIIIAGLKVKATTFKRNVTSLLQHHPAFRPPLRDLSVGMIVYFLFCHVYRLSWKRGEMGLSGFFIKHIYGSGKLNSGLSHRGGECERCEAWEVRAPVLGPSPGCWGRPFFCTICMWLPPTPGQSFFLILLYRQRVCWIASQYRSWGGKYICRKINIWMQCGYNTFIIFER